MRSPTVAVSSNRMRPGYAQQSPTLCWASSDQRLYRGGMVEPNGQDSVNDTSETRQWDVCCQDVGGRDRSLSVSAGQAWIVLRSPTGQLINFSVRQALVLNLRLVSAAKVVWRAVERQPADGSDASWAR